MAGRRWTMALGEVCLRRWEKGEKETNFGLFPVCRGGETWINAAHSGGKRIKKALERRFSRKYCG
ncbi:MAG: hypothetical protein LBT00_03685 [Spirochaetaceae bacterium]|jgi:hypothetical protein|nr:hypothetical protein [Spirochaetaceae bacterium]